MTNVRILSICMIYFYQTSINKRIMKNYTCDTIAAMGTRTGEAAIGIVKLS